MLNMIGAVTLIAIGALLVWASVRVWRVQNKVLKWAGAGLSALLAAAVCLISILTVAGLFEMHTRSASAPALKVVGTPEQIRRGQAIADSFCAACHSRIDLPPRSAHVPSLGRRRAEPERRGPCRCGVSGANRESSFQCLPFDALDEKWRPSCYDRIFPRSPSAITNVTQFLVPEILL
jgi:hypothetical protein